MSHVHVRQIRSALTKMLASSINLSDLAKNATEETRADAVASRALAAYAVALEAGLDPTTVAAYIIDGYGDNGIDVVYFDIDSRYLYVAQSKFSKDGSSSISSGDALKFVSGIRDLLNLNFERFRNNARAMALQNMVQQALDDASTKIVLVIAHTSLQAISDETQHRLDELLKELNDASDIASLRTFNQADVHSSLSGRAEGAPIQLDIMLQEWGQIKEPYQAYYGQVSAAEIAAWHKQFGDRLFTKNIRKGLGATEANRAIATTVRETPQHFFYFNNGVTVLCESVSKKPMGAGTRTSAVLECRGVSVVNGAQTVSSIAAANADESPELTQATVLVRLISLQNCEPDFAVAVTRATNVQNRIEHRDFASLDQLQERLRRELMLEGKVYAYKAGEAVPAQDAGLTMEEAAVALACSLPDLALAVLVKNSVGRIWENMEADTSTYRRIFPEKLSSVHLVRKIEIMRSIDDALTGAKIDSDARQRMVAVHGNRFIAHEVFRRLSTKNIDDPNFDLENTKSEARLLALKILPLVSEVSKTSFPAAYVQSLFKNATRCQVVSKELVSALAH